MTQNGQRRSHRGVKFVRYCQTVSRKTMFSYKKLLSLPKRDLMGDVLAVSRKVGVAPVMIVRHILKLEGYSKQEVREVVDGRLPTPDHLKSSLGLALQNDPVFSPIGIGYGKKRGELGEDLIAAWLDSLSIGYDRDIGQGGPDLLLMQPVKLKIAGRTKKYDWIESKATYGDRFEMKKNRAQFDKYEILGTGIILYWFGVDRRRAFDVFTWKEMMSIVNPNLQSRIKRFLSFVPPEFRHLLEWS